MILRHDWYDWSAEQVASEVNDFAPGLVELVKRVHLDGQHLTEILEDNKDPAGALYKMLFGRGTYGTYKTIVEHFQDLWDMWDDGEWEDKEGGVLLRQQQQISLLRQQQQMDERHQLELKQLAEKMQLQKMQLTEKKQRQSREAGPLRSNQPPP